MTAYKQLCTEVYDLTKPLSSGTELEFYKNNLNKSDLILEPMCGTGRLLIPLLQAGFKVHGLDNSKEMLLNCRNKIATLNLTETVLYEMDMENLQLPTQYDAIIIPFGSFQLLHPRETAFTVLKNIKNYLRTGGKIVIDLFIPWEILGSEVNSKTSKLIKVSENTVIKCETQNVINRYEQYMIGKTRYTKIKEGEITATEDEVLIVAWYFRYEMELILEKLGFTNISYIKHILYEEEMMSFIATR